MLDPTLILGVTHVVFRTLARDSAVAFGPAIVESNTRAAVDTASDDYTSIGSKSCGDRPAVDSIGQVSGPDAVGCRANRSKDRKA